ncbi:MAG TPA: TlpA disulfide reductase family protein [Phnomibacter sp.]|nr:TlpA disulfide reductase family protein [Phnomibacter sp.]
MPPKIYKLGMMGIMLSIVFSSVSFAQEATDSAILTIGDPAPPILVGEWFKGEPVSKFEKDHIYVLDFWAAWCKPCMQAMPDLSTLAKKYKNKITAIGINVMENKYFPKTRTVHIVDSMGRRINFSLAYDSADMMKKIWLDAAHEAAIPRTYVIDGNGKIAWIGHPKKLEENLIQIINNSWDLEVAREKRAYLARLVALDDSVREEVFRFFHSGNLSDFYGEPDSTLLHIDSAIHVYPDLKYTSQVT